MLPFSLSGQAKHFLKQADRELARRLFREIDAPRLTPFPHDVKHVQGRPGVFRVRVGDYRILYAVRDGRLEIVLIDKRSHAYD